MEPWYFLWCQAVHIVEQKVEKQANQDVLEIISNRRKELWISPISYGRCSITALYSPRTKTTSVIYSLLLFTITGFCQVKIFFYHWPDEINLFHCHSNVDTVNMRCVETRIYVTAGLSCFVILDSYDRSREVSKRRDWFLKCLFCFEMRQMIETAMLSKRLQESEK